MVKILRNLKKLPLLSLFFTLNVLFSDSRDFNHEGELNICEESPLFVSLGSYCHPAHMFRYCDLRKVAFPFDWICSMDGDKLIEIIESDFKNFLNEDFLEGYEHSGALLHTYYHLEFLHEGYWRKQDSYLYPENMKKLKSKYGRRIERFKQLKDYKGKVFFIRCAYIHSVTDTIRFYHFHENTHISDESALRLYRLLMEKYPKLDFTLVILNTHEINEVIEEKRLYDNLIIARFNPLISMEENGEKSRKFFIKLLER